MVVMETVQGKDLVQSVSEVSKEVLEAHKNVNNRPTFK